mgnify:CR=1 FL=1
MVADKNILSGYTIHFRNSWQTTIYSHQKYHNIEYFSLEDLKAVVTDIKEKMIEYFSRVMYNYQ